MIRFMIRFLLLIGSRLIDPAWTIWLLTPPRARAASRIPQRPRVSTPVRVNCLCSATNLRPRAR